MGVGVTGMAGSGLRGGNLLRTKQIVWRCGSLIEHLPDIGKALGSIPGMPRIALYHREKLNYKGPFTKFQLPGLNHCPEVISEIVLELKKGRITA